MKQLHIERLELDLRGLPSATAEAAVRLLGPALATALAQCRHRAIDPAAHIDAGRLQAAAPHDPEALATQLAQRIALHASSHGESKP